MLRITERFVAIELHPAVYVSFVAINLCLVFAYRESITGSHHQEHVPTSFASSRLDDPKGLRPDMSEANFGTASARLLAGETLTDVNADIPLVAQTNTEHPVVVKDGTIASPQTAKIEAIAKSSGAALAAEPAKTLPKPKKRTKRSYSGLVPPPPPGVMVVPPPPNAPSLFSAGSAGKFGFLVPPPPPMVFDSVASDFSESVSFRKTTHHRNSGEIKNNDRARTVHRGNYKQVIVSR